jgi:hypothetical protein
VKPITGDVKGAVLQKMMETPAMKKPEMIILTGDMVLMPILGMC